MAFQPHKAFYLIVLGSLVSGVLVCSASIWDLQASFTGILDIFKGQQDDMESDKHHEELLQKFTEVNAGLKNITSHLENIQFQITETGVWNFPSNVIYK